MGRLKQRSAVRAAIAAAGFAVCAGGGLAQAAGQPTCGPRATLLRIEEKICPANDRRPAIVRQRACCQKADGKVRCGHMPHCPRNSPS